MEDIYEDEKPYKGTWKVIALAILALIAIFAFFLGVMPSHKRVVGPYAGSSTLKGVVVGTPQAFDERGEDNYVFFRLENGSDELGFAEVPPTCGDRIGDGTAITVRVSAWNASGIVLQQPRSEEARTRIAKVVCERRIMPATVDVTAEESDE